MTTTTPKLKPTPPKPSAEARARLDTLKVWTEQPNKDAAAEIATPADAAKQPRKARAPRGDAAAQPRTRKPRHAPAPAQHPWETIVDEHATDPVKLVNFKCPADLYKELNWFAGTTFGFTMTRILLEGARIRLDQLRKERGME